MPEKIKARRRMTDLCDSLCAPVAEKMANMISQKAFFWLCGILVTCGITVGAFQWSLIDKVNQIHTVTLLTKQQVEQSNARLSTHVQDSAVRLNRHEEHLHKLEKNYYEHLYEHKHQKQKEVP